MVGGASENNLAARPSYQADAILDDDRRQKKGPGDGPPSPNNRAGTKGYSGGAVLKITFAGLVSCSIKKAERSYRTRRIASEELYSIQRTFSIPPKVTGCSAIGTEVFHGRRSLFFGVSPRKHSCK
jgi:hypothetical protein